MEKCRKHPKYTGRRKPRPTGLYPKGCPKCWEIYQSIQVEMDQKPPQPVPPQLLPHVVKPGQVLNPEGRNGDNNPDSIHEYARRKLKNGKILVDRLDTVSKGEKAGSSVKDEMAAHQLLYKIMKDDEIGDKPQDIRVIVLNVKDATFEEYQRGQDPA